MTWSPEPSPGRARPTIRRMTHAECAAFLARNHVGRIAFATADCRVDIRPVHYAYDPGWLYGRTARGAKLDALDQNRWMAFEVDEVRGPFDWTSVIVHGSFHRLDREGSDDEQRAAVHAIHLLRAVIPETFAADDPADFRTVLFRISIGTVSGRRMLPPASATARDTSVSAAEAFPPPA